MQQTRELETATQLDQIRFVGFSSDETFTFSWFHLWMFSIKMGWSPLDSWWFSDFRMFRALETTSLPGQGSLFGKFAGALADGPWWSSIENWFDLPEAIHYSPFLTTIHAPCSSIFIHFHPCSSIFIHFHPFSSIFIHFHPSSSIFIHFHPFSSIFPWVSHYPIVIPLGTPLLVPFSPGADAAPGVLWGLRGGLGVETRPMPRAELGGAEAEKPPCLGRLGRLGDGIAIGKSPVVNMVENHRKMVV